MEIYQTKTKKLPGTDFKEVHKQAFSYYKEIKSKTKRRPYVRFKKEKIFLELFWGHIFEKKNWRDRMRRLKYFPCAIELIKNSHADPKSKENPNNQSEILHRFAGITKDKDLFMVQIKEEKHTGRKRLISVFPLR